MELSPINQDMTLNPILKAEYLLRAKNKEQGLGLTPRPYTLAKLKLCLLATLGCVLILTKN